MLKVLSSILCDLDPKVKVIGQKAGICDGVPSTSALVIYYFQIYSFIWFLRLSTHFENVQCSKFLVLFGPWKIFYAFCQPIWTKIRPNRMSGLICVQTVCKGSQQTTLSRQKVKALFPGLL